MLRQSSLVGCHDKLDYERFTDCRMTSPVKIPLVILKATHLSADDPKDETWIASRERSNLVLQKLGSGIAGHAASVPVPWTIRLQLHAPSASISNRASYSSSDSGSSAKTM
jgi:hypothetical protein